MQTYVLKDKPIKMVHKTADEYCVIEDTDYVTFNISTIISTGNPGRDSYDPLRSRKHFWQKTFGLAPMPTEEHNASEMFAGSLGLDLDLSPSEIQAAIDEADEG